MKKLFTDSKLRIVMASAVTIILIILAFLTWKGDGESGGWLALFIFLAVAVHLLLTLDFQLPKPVGIVILTLTPAAALCLLEFYTHVPWDLTVPIFILNLIFFYLFYALCSLLLGSARRGVWLATAVVMLFGLTNYFVVSFRGSPIVPWDLFSVGTALSITDNYKFTFTCRVVLVLFGFLFLMLFAGKYRFSIKIIKIRLTALILSLILMGGFVTVVKTDTVKEVFDLDDILFTPNVLYRNNGFMVAFLSNFKYINIEKPKDYSAEKAEEIENKTGEEKDADPGKEQKDLPNIIVIMNEAFSDLAVNGKFETSEDYMPFIHSLKENTVKANMFVSVKGGNTANTEFEFLTGNSMSFLPVGSVAYQQFVKSPMPSVASYLKSLGYSTNAIHPYYASGWNRDQVYPYLGFDKFYSEEDFEKPARIRDYVSDQAAYEKIIELYENKGQGDKLFTFEVTMQNHGGYSMETPDFKEEIFLTQIPEDEKTLSVVSTEKYLTLIRESDRAFEELVSYFKNQEEDTIIVMFGDHQPSDYITDVITNTLNGINPESSIETMQNGYVVPMVMWANYDMEEEQIDALSVNYLSGLLMEKAGIPLTGYQTYLQKLRNTLPVITANTYIDKEGTYHETTDPAFQNLLDEYSILQYNYLRDQKHRNNDFFGGMPLENDTAR